jgi:O-antigen ligase
MSNLPRSLIRWLFAVILIAAFAGTWAFVLHEDKVFFLSILIVTFAAIGLAMFNNLERLAFIFIAAMIPIRVSVNLAGPAEYARAKMASGFIITLTDCLVLVLMIAWGRRVLFMHQPVKFYPRYTLPMGILWIWVVIAGTKTGNDHASGADMVFHFTLGLLLFLYVLNNRYPLKDYFLHSIAVCGMLVFEGLLGIIQQVTGSNAGMEILGAPTTKMDHNTDSRMMGTVPSSNMLGALVSMLIVHPVAMFFSNTRKYKFATLCVLLLVCLTILGTKSRGVWLSSTIVFGYGLYQMFHVRFSALRSGIGVGWLLTFMAIVALSLPGMTDRLFNQDGGSAVARLYMNQIAVNMMVAKPIFGFGWNNYTAHFHEYDDTAVQHSYDFPFIVHNGYLYVGVEYGALALFLMVFIWMRVLRSTLRRRPQGLEYQQLLAFFLPWIFLARMLQAPLYINNPLLSYENWYVLGMCLLFKEWCEEDEKVRAEGGEPESLAWQL